MGRGSGRRTMVHGSAPEPPWVDTQPDQVKALSATRWEIGGGRPTFQCMIQDIQINDNITECRVFTFMDTVLSALKRQPISTSRQF